MTDPGGREQKSEPKNLARSGRKADGCFPMMLAISAALVVSLVAADLRFLRKRV